MDYAHLRTTACVCLALTLTASEARAQDAKLSTALQAGAKPVTADDCVKDLRMFGVQMKADGFWREGSDYGYGFPMGGYGFGWNSTADATGGMDRSALNARPGYELRVLMAASNIVAQNGAPQTCEDVLTTTLVLYNRYLGELKARGVEVASASERKRDEIAAALPVTEQTAQFRSGLLLDTELLDPKGVALGSIHDLVMAPVTGKLAYIVVARGGLFGFNRSFVSVPWEDFRITQGMNTLVLDTTKAILANAPTVPDKKSTTPQQFADQSRTVDAFWKAYAPGVAR